MTIAEASCFGSRSGMGAPRLRYLLQQAEGTFVRLAHATAQFAEDTTGTKPGQFVSAAGLAIALGGCSATSTAVALLRHWIVDPHPPGGKDCCTDVTVLGDINGDGTPEIVVGAERGEGESLVWNQFSTWQRHAIAEGEFTRDGQAIDVDGDGDLDVVVGTSADGKGKIFWYESSEAARGGPWIRHRVGKGYAHDILAGDIDGDGDIDIASADQKPVTVWEAVSGSFVPHRVCESAGEGMALADVERDGQLDIDCGRSGLANPGSLRESVWSHTKRLPNGLRRPALSRAP